MAPSALQFEYISQEGDKESFTVPPLISVSPFADRRKYPRTTVVKSGRIFTEEGNPKAVFECLIIDQSRTGVLIDLGTPLDTPMELTLQISEEGVYRTRRVWSIGTRAGLEFIGDQIISGELAERMVTISELLKTESVHRAFRNLGTANYFDNDGLRQAAMNAESSYNHLVAMLSCFELL
jgi:hypothetical protein